MSAHNDRYGHRHRRLRAQVKRDVEAGLAVCSRCGRPIHPFQAWELDHVDGGGDRDYRGPSHRRCNRAVLTYQAQRRQAAAAVATSWEPATLPATSFPDPDPGNGVVRWSRHWQGPANPRCPACVALDGPCPDAEVA